jgi:hypothetical protein
LENRPADNTDVNGEQHNSGKGFGIGGISRTSRSLFFLLHQENIGYNLHKTECKI